MLASKLLVVFSVLTTSILAMSVGAGVATADGVRVEVPTPFFYPRAEFQYDGYYRTNDGRYYHYDSDRDGWHYGRTHREGVRYEEHHHGRR